MKKTFFCLILIGSIITVPAAVKAASLIFDHFTGTIASSLRWHIPTWTSPTDGTFIGRTQFRCSQNSPLPSARNSNAKITVETYNPTGFSFYGTDLISNKAILLGSGVDIKVRAKINPGARGLVGGIFLYDLNPNSSSIHNEIDFELLTNRPNQAQTNIYKDEPLGVGHPQFVSFATGTIYDYHNYRIVWRPNKVSWFIDGKLVRTNTANVPSRSMHLHLNMWVPAADWAEAYNGNLQPVKSAGSNRIFTMDVDSVSVNSLPL